LILAERSDPRVVMIKVLGNVSGRRCLMFPAMVLLGMMLFMWGAAVWATMLDEDDRHEPSLQDGTSEKWAA
jgi:hypothetical protein